MEPLVVIIDLTMIVSTSALGTFVAVQWTIAEIRMAGGQASGDSWRRRCSLCARGFQGYPSVEKRLSKVEDAALQKFWDPGYLYVGIFWDL